MARPELILGNIFVRPNQGNKGERVDLHTHKFDHTMIFFTGRFRVLAIMPDGRLLEKEFHAPDLCLIKAEVAHEVSYLENGSEFMCVFAHRDPQGRVTQHYTGWEEAYG